MRASNNAPTRCCSQEDVPVLRLDLLLYDARRAAPGANAGQFFHVAQLHTPSSQWSTKKEKKPIAVLAILGLFAPLWRPTIQ